MKLKVKSGVGMALSMLSAVGVSLTLLSQATVAQQSNLSPLQDFNSQHNDSGTSLGIDQSTMYNLIHRAQMGTLDLDVNSVYDQQKNNIQDAAAEFRAKQRQVFEQRNPQLAEDGTSSVGDQMKP
ncbi:hypothetical protein [Limnoraphis robusta]|jgi:hypothetical protein|uniref:Uncharacterized protein n=1 Tax=Limnoraphis robusta CCNP1315 TaxID=3110306 RepID=A0ABU5TRA3_9CYAN|nr:hypothetical protein [Limnoraphis robusta]MEA5498479.1 hypothetical protein [Limnoraphis robusta BA-68 BA1]MEA5517448.1 hypothetical protein [Limnoraphis robusta CCNP1315]MEA5545964.1 hypothetical protein [Limnoraphis robusta CCNP1324]